MLVLKDEFVQLRLANGMRLDKERRVGTVIRSKFEMRGKCLFIVTIDQVPPVTVTANRQCRQFS